MVVTASRAKMLWKRQYFELGDDEQDIQLEELWIFAVPATYTCQVNSKDFI